jgi:dTDP-4-amino-4,6-dideoxygalactose transaminase
MIPLFKTAMSPEANEAAGRVLSSGYVGQGSKVEEFETILKSYLRNPNVVTVNSATSGLTLALHMLKLPFGTKVLTTPLTCTATNWAIRANWLTPLWVDVNPFDLGMDVDDLVRKLDKDTRVIMLVHWGGFPQDIDRIEEIRQDYQKRFGQELYVIHDCAHAWESDYRFKPLAAFGKHYFVYSFGPVKTLTCVDGGCLVTPDEESCQRAKLLRWYGIDRDNRDCDIAEPGFKYHMNDLNAAIGLANLPYARERASLAIEHAEWYTVNHFFRGHVPGLTIPKAMESIAISLGWLDSSYYLYTAFVERREAFIAAMKERGVECGLPHKRNDCYKCVDFLKTPLPNLDSIYDKLVCIPVGWWLTEEDVRHVCQSVEKGW